MSRVARGVNLLSLSLSLSFPAIFPVFSFFATKKINGEREYVKRAYFSAPSSCEHFMRCAGASARFSAPLSRARSPVNALKSGEGQGDMEVMTYHAPSAKLVFCLGSQILKEKPRLGTIFPRFSIIKGIALTLEVRVLITTRGTLPSLIILLLR